MTQAIRETSAATMFVNQTLARIDRLSNEMAELRQELTALRHLVVLPQSVEEWARVISRALETSEDREQCDVLTTAIPADLRHAVAAEVYWLNEKVTLARAADIAGVFTWEIATILREHGVEPEYAEATVEEMEQQIALLEARRW